MANEMQEVQTVVDKARLKVFKTMNPATQEIARDLEQKIGRGSQGVIILQYQMGCRVKEVMEGDEAVYGAGAIKKLAAYLNLNSETDRGKSNKLSSGETLLYDLKNFSDSFELSFVKEMSAKPMANGSYLTLGHWFRLMRVSEQKEQNKLLDRIFKNSLSVNDLEKEIRAGGIKTKNKRGGGRNPKPPSSPIAGLQKSFQLAQQFNNLEPVLEEMVFDKIDEIDSDHVNQTLLERLTTTKETMEKLGESAEKAIERLDKNIERVQRILDKKYEEAEENLEREESEDENETPRKKSSGKASSNGHAGKHGKKKKKKNRKPQAATA